MSAYDTELYNAINYNNALQMASAERQMQFQEYMSSSAHTREVQDLLNAGLNPVLSAGGTGATTPNGSQASVDTSASAYIINKMNNETNRYISNNSLQGALANAGAMVQSAMLNSAAAMYSANQHYNASVYSADKAYESTVYGTDFNRSGTWAGTAGALMNRLLDAYANATPNYNVPIGGSSAK